MFKQKTTDFYCLGIESTADDFSVGILKSNGEILANIISAYVPTEGGIHPREAARHHAEVASEVLEEAFMKSKVHPFSLEAIAFSQGPGLGPSLRTGDSGSRSSWRRTAPVSRGTPYPGPTVGLSPDSPTALPRPRSASRWPAVPRPGCGAR